MKSMYLCLIYHEETKLDALSDLGDGASGGGSVGPWRELRIWAPRVRITSSVPKADS